VLLGGINSFTVLRMVVEAEHWAERLERGGRRGVRSSRIGEHALGYVKDPEVRVDTLLKKVDGYEGVRVRSVVWSNMPERMLPLTEAGERTLVETLVEELHTNFGVRVSSSIGMTREGGKVQPMFKYAVIGASNADRVGVTEGEWQGCGQVDKRRAAPIHEGSGRDGGEDDGGGPGGKSGNPLWHGQWRLLQGR
jgi:hypothetical protein